MALNYRIIKRDCYNQSSELYETKFFPQRYDFGPDGTPNWDYIIKDVVWFEYITTPYVNFTSFDEALEFIKTQVPMNEAVDETHFIKQKVVWELKT